jgi:poly(hydroxyalkanoate) depolymerase family esterase
MRKLSDTVARLAALRVAPAADGISRLTRLRDFGSNPGALGAHVYVPPGLPSGAALVVVLHGCTQTAAGYDMGAGWSQMADRHGFAVLFPEQQRQNNPNLCFNWFVPEHSRRESGEALSVRQMVAAVTQSHSIDPERVFVTGLSAGGAMASVMLATYPEVFAGGAIIAGLPFGCASTIPQAFDRMRGAGLPSDAELTAMVRDASDHHGPWPTISIWHGSADSTVNPSNVQAIIGQWRALHGVGTTPDRIEAVDGYPRRVWFDRADREVIEEFSITGMGHGTPLDSLGADGCGKSGPYMLEASISSTQHICRFWGIDGEMVEVEGGSVAARHPDAPVTAPVLPSASPASTISPTSSALFGSPSGRSGMGDTGPTGVGKVIEDALRAAGLMR